MLQCIIIEDQPPAQRILKKYIEEIDFLELKNIFPDTIKAKEYMLANKVDVIFLDIHLPKISGIDYLKSNPNHPKVILTTAFSDFALESYEFNVVDYLLKPISFERFLKATGKLEASFNLIPNQFPASVFIKSGYTHVKLDVSTIIYIKSDSDYTEIITTKKTYICKESLKYWLQKLNTLGFCQIHKSYIINIKHVTKITGNQAYLEKTNLPIGRAYKKHFMDNYLT